MDVKRQLLFVQGGGKGAHDEWDNKLVESLRRQLGQDYEIRYPRMPNEDDPDYAPWKETLERELEALQDGAILVGHSVGGTILVKMLAERLPARKLGAIFLIAAPFVGDGGWPSDDFSFLPTLVRGFLKASLSISITGLRMKSRHRRMSISTHARFRKPTSSPAGPRPSAQ